MSELLLDNPVSENAGREPDYRDHYAFKKVTDGVGAIRSAVDVLPLYRNGLEYFLPTDKKQAKQFYQQIEKDLAALSSAIGEMRLPLLELDQARLATMAGALSTQLKSFEIMTPDYSKLTAVLKQFADGCDFDDPAVSAKVIARLMNHVKMGYYPTCLENIGHIMRAIAFPSGVTTNLLDPCCGCGTALKKLAVGNNCYTFGVELDRDRAEEAQEKLHRVGFGSFFHSRISRERFHVVFLNPPYLSVMTKGGGRSRDEKRFLIESLPYLMPGGLLIYIVPYYRLTPDICRILCDNFSDLSIHRFTDAEFRKYSQVAVMGVKKAKEDGSEQARVLAELACRPEAIPLVTQLAEGRYPLPAIPQKVELFKGEIFNQYELARQLRDSHSFEALFSKSKLDTEEKRPLLPLSIGQVGLIGGSGLINGLIDCDFPHIIKGRVVKQRRTEQSEERRADGKLLSTEIRETVSNKMIFNLLTPNGFRSLN